MPTVRQSIRKGYAALLEHGVQSVAGRVYSSRRPRLAKGSSPCLSIHLGDAMQNPITQRFPRTIENRMEVVIVGYSDAHPEEVEDVLESLIDEVDKALVSNWKLGGVVKSLNPSRVRLPDPADKDAPQGVVEAAYEVVFYTVEGHMETAQ